MLGLTIWRDVESIIDEFCKKFDLDPIEVRLKNAVKEGSKSSFGPRFQKIGLVLRKKVSTKIMLLPSMVSIPGPNTIYIVMEMRV